MREFPLRLPGRVHDCRAFLRVQPSGLLPFRRDLVTALVNWR